MASKEKFTFKNYVKTVKKSWLFVVIFFVIGIAAGAWYAFRKPTEYSATAKFSVYNSVAENGAATSPYAQIAELVSSKSLLKEANVSVDTSKIGGYLVKESNRGVFLVTSTEKDEETAKNTVNAVVYAVSDVLAYTYDDSDDYKVTILEEATSAAPTASTKSRIISVAIAAFGMLALALIILFIRFDYTAEK